MKSFFRKTGGVHTPTALLLKEKKAQFTNYRLTKGNYTYKNEVAKRADCQELAVSVTMHREALMAMASYYTNLTTKPLISSSDKTLHHITLNV